MTPGRHAGRVHLVSGGSSGIGRAAAERLAAEGAAVVIGARRRDEGERVAAGIRAAGGRAVFVRADATVDEDAKALVDAAVGEFGGLHGAFNNAGGVLAPGPVPDVSPEGWAAELELNLTSVFLGMRHQLPALLATGAGAVLNNASIAGRSGRSGIPGMAAYVAAKHGVVGLTRSAALETAGRGVRVNALVTGNVDTPLYRRLVGAPETGPADLPAPNPAGRLATAGEVAGFVAWLLSDEAAFVTGAELAIDGGDGA